MFNKKSQERNRCQLYGGQARKGYDWWWHSFTAYNKKTGEARPFFLEFFLINPKYGEEEPILGQLKDNIESGKKPSYLMVKIGYWGKGSKQLHRFFGWKKIKVNYKAPFSIEADDCYLDEYKSYGHISLTKEEIDKHKEYMSDYGSISWNLEIEKDIAFNVGFGAGWLFRHLQLFEMFWHAEGMKSRFKGSITVDNEEYIVRKEDSYGYSDKNWGKDFTSPWVWLSSNNLISNITGKKLSNSVFDIGGGRPKVGPIALKGKLLSAFYYEGKCYEFNFSKFWTNTRTKFDCYETDTHIVWHVEQRTWNNRMVTDITCLKEDMLLVNYEAPNGKKLHNRLFNGGNGIGRVQLFHKGKLIDDVSVSNVGCEYGEYGDSDISYRK